MPTHECSPNWPLNVTPYLPPNDIDQPTWVNIAAHLSLIPAASHTTMRATHTNANGDGGMGEGSKRIAQRGDASADAEAFHAPEATLPLTDNSIAR